MRTIHRFFPAVGALLLATSLGQCNGSPQATPDGGSKDMAGSNPDLNNAVTITAVMPNSASNAGGATITITGTRFAPFATVSIAGAMATNVTVVNSTTITATVPAKAATCGLSALKVTNADMSSATRSDLFYYQTGTLGFATGVPYAMGTNPRQVLVVDLNKDGKLDVVTCNSGSANLGVRLGNGDGTFGTLGNPTIGVNRSPYGLVAADFNGDGKLDIVTVDNAGNGITVRLGVGDGTFTTPATPTFAAGASPYDIAVGDLNGDQKMDVVVANSASNTVTAFLGQGDGTFAAQAPAPAVSGTAPHAIILADFNNDTKLDFATADSNSNGGTVKLGSGSGTFGVGSAPTATTPNDLVSGDFNGDGKLDVIFANSVSTVRLDLGDGQGGFINGATPTVGAGATYRSIATGDFNSDGKIDVAVTNDNGTVSILLSNGDGTFAMQQTFTVGTQPGHISVADVNKDGLPDLVTTDLGAGGIVVSLNQCK